MEVDPTCRTAVGVVQDVMPFSLVGDARAVLYLPRSDSAAARPPTAMLLRVDESARVGTVAAAVRRDLQSLAPDMPYVQVRPSADVFSPELAPWRLGAEMSSGWSWSRAFA